MSGTTITHGDGDRPRVSVSDEKQVRYWTEALGATREELTLAIRTVGNHVDAVRGWLKRRRH